MRSIHRSVTLPSALALVLVTLALVLVTGCRIDGATGPTSDIPEKVGSGAEPDASLPAWPGAGGFVAGISNPYLAFAPGKVFEYAGETQDGLERIRVEVTRQHKTILDVRTTVVHEQVFLDDKLVEDTLDWYAQDAQGNVWYFGEDSKTLDGNNNVISTEGSWEAGVDDARPGILMLAHPEDGVRYQQESAEGVAEDMAKVVSLSASVAVQYGTFTGCLKTLEWTPLDPGAREHKYYAPGIGLVLEESAKGGKEPIELISVDP